MFEGDVTELIKRVAFAFEIAFIGYIIGMMSGYDKARISALEDAQESPCAKRARMVRENRKDET